jgi:hypothetical protein
MDKIALTDFQKLLEYSHPFSISLYFSSDEVGLEPLKRKAEFQSLEKEILDQLNQLGATEPEIKQVVRSLNQIKEKDELWAIGPKGFAAFISPDFCQLFQLPIEVKNLALISFRFHLKPLIRLLAQPCEFYLLSLTKKKIQLYKGDLYGLESVDVPDLPKSFEEVVGVETSERHLQFHTRTTTPHGGGRPAIFHGSSSWGDDKHKYLARYLQQVDHAVEKLLRDTNLPLILSGVERMVTTYQGANTYAHLLPELFIKGSNALANSSKLHTKALEILEPYFVQQEKDVIEKYFAHGGTNQFSFELEEILREARLGRVDTLVVAQGVREWGQFNPDTLQVTHSAEPTTEAHDLLDIACAQTLLTGGRAFVLPPDQIPLQKPAAAVFRY